MNSSIRFARNQVLAKKLRLVYLMAALAVSLALLTSSPRAAKAAGIVTDCVNFFGPGTLSAALPGGGAVTFACDGFIIVPARINISSNTTLDAAGHNVTLSGNSAAGLFKLNPGISLTVNGLSLIKGRDGLSGGAIYNPGGKVFIYKSTLYGNFAPSGGAIYNQDGQVYIYDTTFLYDNAYDGSGGAIYSAGPNAYLSVTRTTFDRNNAVSYGGAIYLQDTQASVSNSTFADNSSKYGGAIFVYKAKLELLNDTLACHSER
jgi:predicted outer membrane repeat protein